MTNITVDQARRDLELAQANLAKAEAAEREIISRDSNLGEVVTAYAVIAKVPEFGAFVGYSETGILQAVLPTEEEAGYYVMNTPAPRGYALVVEPVPSYQAC